MVEVEEFRALLLYLNPTIDNHLPSSHNTIQQWTLWMYSVEKGRIQQKLQSALLKIHFTVDLWTSLNSLAILGVIGHYIPESGLLQHLILALKELDGTHSGENQAGSIMEVINDYRIASKVGYFMMDNVSNNDTMIYALLTCTSLLFNIVASLLILEFIVLFDQYQINYKPLHHRLRYNGHIINLSAQAFLFQTKSEALSIENNTLVPPTILEMEY
jgi:hypothetical protein